MIDIGIERLKQLPLNPDAIWEGGWRPLTGVSIATDSSPRSYSIGLWGCPGRHVVGPSGDLIHPAKSATPDKLLDLMVAFACNDNLAGYRPGLVRVDDKETAVYLADLLADTDIEVAQVSDLPLIDDATDDMNAHLSRHQSDVETISLFTSPDLSVDQIIEFGDAAAEFHRVAPWTMFCDQDLLTIASSFDVPDLKYAVILGNAGLEYGLGFYPDAERHYQMQCGIDPRKMQDADEATWFFSYCERRDNKFRDLVTEWTDNGMPLASASAFPLFICVKPDGMPRLPGPTELEYLTGLLRALSRTTTTMADTGRWTISVPTGPRDSEFTLELPYVLEPLTLKDAMKWGIRPDPRANEGVFSAISSLAMSDIAAGMNVDELNDKIAGKSFDEVTADADLPNTPEQRARSLCFTAYDAIGYRKQVLARQALQEDPDCIDALTILAEECIVDDERRDLYGAAAEAARRRFDFEALSREEEDLYRIHEVRPALRALAGAAFTNVDDGHMDGALDYGLELLKCHPSDMPGVRHFVVNELLVRDRIKDVAALLEQWPELGSVDEGPLIPPDEGEYMTGHGDHLFLAVVRIILDARSGADPTDLVTRLRDLKQRNRYLLPLLMDGKKPPRSAMSNFSLGGGVVADFTGSILKSGWAMTPGLSELPRSALGHGKKKGNKKKKKGRR